MEEPLVDVLGFVGSPRERGNTRILVETVLEAASEAGCRTAVVPLAQKRILPCMACDACRRQGACIQCDDMPDLLRRMAHSPVWILGTPVYWWGPSAQFKLFMDRWYGAQDLLWPKEKAAIVAVTLGDTDTATARHTVGMLEDALAYLEVTLLRVLVAPGVIEAGQIRSCPNVLAAASQAGREAASWVRGRLF